MRRSEVLPEVRLLGFEEVYGQFQKRRLNCGEAAELSGASVKTFYRMRRQDEAEGPKGLLDGRLGRVSARRTPVDGPAVFHGPRKPAHYDSKGQPSNPKSKEKAAPDHDPPCLTGLAARHLPKGVARNSHATGLT